MVAGSGGRALSGTRLTLASGMPAAFKKFQQNLRRSTLGRAVKSAFRFPFAVRAAFRDQLAAKSARYPFAVCAIFKNEAPYFDDWIKFHRGIGAHHFYLYNNNSDDNFREILAHWLAKGYVTLHDWPGKAVQRSAYLHCLKTYWRDARWIAFLDLDEFLFTPHDKDVPSVLEKHSAYPALFVHWHIFGSNGHVSNPKLPPPEAFTRRSQQAVSGKSIVKPALVRNVPQSHIFSLWRGVTHDTEGRMIDGVPTNVAPTFAQLRINHYWSRSLEELEQKAKREDAFYGQPQNLDTLKAFERTLNDVEDKTILPVWNRIKTEAG